MERATGLHSTVERTASMLGAGFAGGLVAVVGAANALVVDARQLRAVAPPSWPGRPGRSATVRRPTDEPTTRRRTSTRLREGWDFLRARPRAARHRGDGRADQPDRHRLRRRSWCRSGPRRRAAARPRSACSSRCSSGASVARRARAPRAWGERLPRFKTYLVAFLIAGAPQVRGARPRTRRCGVVLAVAVVGGFASGFLNPILGAVIFERIPAPLVGRVTSLSTRDVLRADAARRPARRRCWSAALGLSTALLVARCGVLR